MIKVFIEFFTKSTEVYTRVDETGIYSWYTDEGLHTHVICSPLIEATRDYWIKDVQPIYDDLCLNSAFKATLASELL